jgi:hypothetical protein
MICPCENCLVKPVCRNKHYTTLHRSCNIIEEYLVFNSSEHKKRVKELEKVLKSYIWKLAEHSETAYHLAKR